MVSHMIQGIIPIFYRKEIFLRLRGIHRQSLMGIISQALWEKFGKRFLWSPEKISFLLKMGIIAQVLQERHHDCGQSLVCCKKLTKFPKNATVVRFIGEFSGILKDDHKKVQKCNRPCYFWGNFFQVQKRKKNNKSDYLFPIEYCQKKVHI